jgi:hypothetical protein
VGISFGSIFGFLLLLISGLLLYRTLRNRELRQELVPPNYQSWEPYTDGPHEVPPELRSNMRHEQHEMDAGPLKVPPSIP